MLIIKGKTYITTKEAAKLTHYDIYHIQRLARQEKIKAIRIGHIWAICKESVLAYRPIFDKPMIGKIINKSRYTSQSTALIDRPSMSDQDILANEERIKEIQSKAAFALYVDVDGNPIRTIERKK